MRSADGMVETQLLKLSVVCFLVLWLLVGRKSTIIGLTARSSSDIGSNSRNHLCVIVACIFVASDFTREGDRSVTPLDATRVNG